jgi:hypothetical protein
MKKTTYTTPGIEWINVNPEGVLCTSDVVLPVLDWIIEQEL